MGRRPNAIISEWFSRGAKIDDASNRYAHTCRKCGELFAKGRVEYLMQHLLKRCSNVTEADRDLILLQMHQNPAAKPSKRPSRGDHFAAVDTGLAITLERQQSALDTLAEVSRHHLDYSVQRHLPLDATQFNGSDQDLAEQALWAQLQQHTIDLPAQGDTNTYNITPGHQHHEVPYTSEAFPAGLPPPEHESQQDFTQSQSQYPVNFSQLDPQLGHDHAVPFPADLSSGTYPPSNSVDQSAHATHMPHENPQSVFVRYAPDAQDTAGSGDIANDHANQPRTRARGRFTENRRREVQEIRKRGACIRCRMLKKPCSEGTPCKTCANVDVARLWKGRCLRTKLSDEFSAWNAGLFNALWASQIHGGTTDESAMATVDVEVYLFSLETQPSQHDSLLIPASMRQYQPYNTDTTAKPIIILDNADVYVEQLAKLCMTRDVLDTLISLQKDSLIATTILEARRLCNLDNSSQQPSSDAAWDSQAKSDTRACYNLANLLVYNTLQLWFLTEILTNWHGPGNVEGHLLSFQLRNCSSTSLTEDMVAALAADNHAALRLQLQILFEWKAAKLSKAVLTDMERHLLQRQQVSSYATFIAAVILLGCVERMTEFYNAFDSDSGPSVTSPANSWPLPIAPVAIWSQGPTFAQLLQMLLRMRGLPPNTIEDKHGNLAVRDESSEAISKINGSVSEEQLRAQDEQRREALTDWLRRCKVSAKQVRSWLDQEHGWHGKFIAGTLVE